jgi:hypothetical protein
MTAEQLIEGKKLEREAEALFTEERHVAEHGTISKVRVTLYGNDFCLTDDEKKLVLMIVKNSVSCRRAINTARFEEL